ncbi:MAG: DNA-processing protein DprA [Firmicutes bacterium]|nr:DNA-processing protein DprA [Bacillota bacterium]
MDSREVKYLLSLGQIPNMNQTMVTSLMDAFGSAETAWQNDSEWDEVLPLSREKVANLRLYKKEVDPEMIEAYCRKIGVKVVTVEDDDFPDYLRHVDYPPYYLYYFGTLPDPDLLSIAVVGARKYSDYGKAATEKIVTDLVEKAGVHIVNGMAEGVDGAALKAALRAGGHPTAVLGTGIDVIYPAFHRSLYAELKEKGCILTEYPFGMQGLKQNFPMRNRLVTGLSNGVLIPEASRKSGTLHSVRHGLDQGKNIYAMPGSVFSKLSELPHYLIQSGQAKFAACAEDILEDFLDLDLVERLSHSDEIDAFQIAADEQERSVVLELQHGRRTFDELLEVSKLSPSRLTTFLTRLEIEGAIKETPGNTYMLISQ